MGSPNYFIDEKNNEINYHDKESVKLEFCSYKWQDPLNYMGNSNFTKQDCINEKWISVDDINYGKENVVECRVDAFINFIIKN